MLELALLGTGCSNTSLDETDDGSGQDEGALSRLPPSSVLGAIAYGESKTFTMTTRAYRAYSFTGTAGDDVVAHITSSRAMLDGAGRVVLAVRWTACRSRTTAIA